MATVKIEGSEMELPDDICKTDKSLRDALTPFYPGAANSDVKRETKGDKTVITVTKRAGHKGSYEAVFDALDRAPEELSPVLTLPARAKRSEVDEAITRSLADEREVMAMAAALDASPAAASLEVPAGF